MVKQFTMQRKVTLKEVAAASGYALSTVSMALRDHSKIPAETRLKIRETAQRLGYEKDPMLSALAAYRDRGRSISTWRGGIAALTLDKGWPWRAIPFWENVLASMRRAAADLGYFFVEYTIDTPGTSFQRHQQILHTRGIRGLVLQPAESFPYDAFDWKHFSVIGFGFDPSRRFHAVATDNFRAVLGCVDQALHAGYTRIGLILPERMMDSRHFREIGAFLANREMLSGTELFFLKKNTNSMEVRQRWLQRHAIEVVISNTINMAMDEQGVSLPFLDINVIEQGSAISGYHHPPEEIGDTLVHQLHGLIIRGVNGIPRVQTSVQVAGVWNSGETLPARSSDAP